MAEVIYVREHEYEDRDGNLVSTPRGIVPGAHLLPGAQTIPGFTAFEGVVDDQSQNQIAGQGIHTAYATIWRIITDPGNQIEAGDVLLVRGLEFDVIYPPFDWSIGRRPWNPLHRPKVTIVIGRKAE